MSKYSKEEEFRRGLNANKVNFDRTYYKQDDPLQMPLEANDLVKGYTYGQ